MEISEPGTGDVASCDDGLIAPYQAHADLIVGGRSDQQDYVRLLVVPTESGPYDLLVVVADGMGGHVGGAIASQVAVDAYIDSFGEDQSRPLEERLRTALDRANEAIGERIYNQPDLKGMGCTLVAALQSGRQVAWVSVGDTILSEIRNGIVQRLNADHSMAPLLDEQALSGEITPEEAQASDLRHMLRSALTGSRIAMVDEGGAVLTAGSLLFAATDGLHSLTDRQLVEVATMSESPAAFVQGALKMLLADMSPDQDNTALAALQVPGNVTKRISAESDLDIQGKRWRWKPIAFLCVVILIVVGLLNVKFGFLKLG